MPKTRKIEAAEVTQAGATAPVSVRRRTATGSGARKAATPRTRTSQDIPAPAAEEAAAVAPAEILIERVTIAGEVVETPVAVVETPVIEVAVGAEPTREQIAALAYSYWVNRGYQGGSPEQDWLYAERELRGALAVE